MQKISTLIICTLLIACFIGIFSIPTSVAEPIIIYVDDDNTAGPWNGTQDYPYQYIQDAIDNASNPGDIIYVYAGMYVEQIDVTMSLILQGENKDTTIVNGGFNVSRDTTTIQNFTITYGYEWDPDGADRNGTHRIGILTNSSDNTFIDNTLYDISGGIGENDEDHGGGTGGSGIGIYLTSSSIGDIQNNTIYDLQGGSGGGGGSGGLGGNCIGIYLTSSSGITISHNGIDGLIGGAGGNDDPGGNGGISAGIHLESTTGITIIQNSITNITGGAGGNTDFGGNGGIGAGIYLLTSGTNILIDNTILHLFNGTAGVGGIEDGVDGMGVGLYGEDSNDNTIRLCTMTYGFYGITLLNSSDNLCFNNYFSNNSYNAYDNGTNEWNTVMALGINIIGGVYLGGNYWSNYTGSDANNDGLGDTPYPIPGGINQDTLPLVNQPPNTPNSENPADNTTNISIGSNLTWSGGDPDGDTVTYDVFFGSSSPPTKVSSNQSATSYDPTLINDMTYFWRIVAWDSNDATTSGPEWNFTTTSPTTHPPTFTPTPANGQTDVPLSQSVLRVVIQDLDGDTFDWSINTNPNIGNSSGLNATNGTRNCTITVALQYSTTYTWSVKAYDGTYWTNKTYWFITTSGGGGPPGPEYPPGEPNQKPIANVSSEGSYQGLINIEIVFDGSNSRDPDGNITAYIWDFGDGAVGLGETIGHTYSQAGTFVVNLTVTDDDGAKDSDLTSCLVKSYNRPPSKPILTGPRSGTKNTIYNYTGIATDLDNDTIRYSFNWGDFNSETSGYVPNGMNYTMNHSWAAAGRYTITLWVSDHQEEVETNMTVYIDAVQTRGAGYLLDIDGDGIYDAFYSEESKQTITTVQQQGDSYLIDSDGDGEWDYKYNATHGISSYQKPRKTPGFEFTFFLCSVVLWILIWKKKRLFR